MSNVFITGDTHGDFTRIKEFCNRFNTSIDDTMIILGDSGINYYTDTRCRQFKYVASKLPITLFCIHGNHEERASNISSYIQGNYFNSRVLYEKEFKNIKFALDGKIYKIPTMNGIKSAIVIGGAYSVDKYYRLARGINWYESEQLTKDEMHKISEKVLKRKNDIDMVLTHTCPTRYIPTEWFISGADQSSVDRSMENWLDDLYERCLKGRPWYCGHYHGDKIIDNMTFMYNTIRQL